MFYTLWIFFTFSLFIHSSFSTCECNKHSNNCNKNENSLFEMQCPTSSKHFTILVEPKSKEITVNCPKNLGSLPLNDFPNFPIYDITTFTMMDCPLMKEPFSQILARFSIQKIKFLEFSNSNTKVMNLTSRYFRNLSILEELKISQGGLRELDEDVFVHIPNLQKLDLEQNRITLTSRLFETVPLLTFLDLSFNGITAVPSGVFEPLKQLKILHLWRNKLTKIEGATFRGLLSLNSLEMSYNKIEEVSEDAFRELPSLEKVSLSRNKIKSLPQDVFRYNKQLKLVILSYNFNLVLPDFLFTNTSIEHVDFNGCQMGRLNPHVFHKAFKMKSVKLDNNSLKELPEGLFAHLKNLTKLMLQFNKIESVDGVFKGLKRLKILSLYNNAIKDLPAEALSDLVNLQRISLKSNRLESIDSGLFSNKTKLNIISLAFNNISTPLAEIVPFQEAKSLVRLNLKNNSISKVELENIKPSFNLTINLDFNSVRDVHFENTNPPGLLQISLKNNSLDCDCHNYQLIEYAKSVKPHNPRNLVIFIKTLLCAEPPLLRNKLLSDVELSSLCPLEKVSNSSSCPDKCDCSWIPSNTTIYIDCSYRNLTEYPTIDLSNITIRFSQTEGHFEGNYLTGGPSESFWYENMTKLVLSHNKIRQIDWLPSRLEALDLDHNLLSTLKEEVLEFLNSTLLVKLSLNDNPWVCDCDSQPFAYFLSQTKNLVHVISVDCINKIGESLLNLKKSDLCVVIPKKYAILVVLSCLLVLAVALALYYRYQQQIKLWLFSKHLCLCWVTEEELDKDKTYDAFISFHHKDEVFVVNLVKMLETPPDDYKVCVHYRDWAPGEFISDQINNSVSLSRRTLIILSNNFLESIWGKMEFRTAHSQAMSDGRTRVIIILYDDVDVNNLDEELRLYLKTTTYVKKGDPYFWEKLKYALPHKVRRPAKEREVSNLMNCNEKATLIKTGSSCPGSTPPICSNLDKINPLVFGR